MTPPEASSVAVDSDDGLNGGPVELQAGNNVNGLATHDSNGPDEGPFLRSGVR